MPIRRPPPTKAEIAAAKAAKEAKEEMAARQAAVDAAAEAKLQAIIDNDRFEQNREVRSALPAHTHRSSYLAAYGP